MIQEMKQPLVNQSARFQRSVTYSESPWSTEMKDDAIDA